MSAEVEKGTDQVSGLLSFLSGAWTTRFTVYVRFRDGGLTADLCYGRTKVRGLFQALPDGGVAGHYMPIENQAGDDESFTDCILRFEVNRSTNALLAYLGSDKSVPGIKGVWTNSGFHFRGDVHDGIVMWEVFRAISPPVTARPSTVSIIIHQVSVSSWLLDVAFVVEESYPSQAKKTGLRCRLEFWHFRELTDATVPIHPQAVEEAFNNVIQKCNDAAQDIETRIGELDDLIASLEGSRAECEKQLQLLGEVKTNAESGKDDADSLADAMQGAILELHDSPTVSAEGSTVAEAKEILARTWPELDGLQADAESLDIEIDDIATDLDLSDDLIASVWTNAGYARAQRLLRENRNHLPLPDLSFLGLLQPTVIKLSKDAATMIKTTAVLVQAALRGELLEELDYGPVIASMAKVCERTLADVFTEKMEPIQSDPAVGALVLDVRSWQYRIPAGMSNVTLDGLTKVVKMVKKSIETNNPINWNGMGNKRIALLLFGGWIPIYQATREHVLNPLGVDRSGEFAQALPDRLSEIQNLRNGFLHHDLADGADLLRTWECFQDCLKGLLQAAYSGSVEGVEGDRIQ